MILLKLRICPEDVHICSLWKFKLRGNILEELFVFRDFESLIRLHLLPSEELFVLPIFEVLENVVARLRFHSLLAVESDFMFLQIGLEAMGLRDEVSKDFHLFVDI